MIFRFAIIIGGAPRGREGIDREVLKERDKFYDL
jgi:hypothetical protein